MEATALLRTDHATIRGLSQRLAQAGGQDSHRRRNVFRSLKAELEAHARVEEEVFYPAVMRLRSAAAREAVRLALEEHQAVDGLLAEIDQMEPEDPRFEARASVLRAAVERHLEREEALLFAQARIHLTDERLEALGLEMQARKAVPVF